MTLVLKLIDRLCVWAAGVAAVLLAILFALGFAEIVMRSAFGISLHFVVEYSGYLLVLVLFLGSGWTFSQGGHIRVTLLSEHIAPNVRRVLDLSCTSVALVISSTLAVSLVSYAVGTWSRGTVSYFASETPLAYPQMLFAMGPVILMLAVFARLVRLLRGDVLDQPEPSKPDAA